MRKHRFCRNVHDERKTESEEWMGRVRKGLVGKRCDEGTTSVINQKNGSPLSRRSTEGRRQVAGGIEDVRERPIRKGSGYESPAALCLPASHSFIVSFFLSVFRSLILSIHPYTHPHAHSATYYSWYNYFALLVYPPLVSHYIFFCLKE